MQQKDLYQLAQELQPRLVDWRRDFHRHPEIGYEEHRTSEIVATHLESLGLEVTRHVGKTGVVGLLRGRLMDQPLHFERIWMHYRFRIRKQ